MTDTDAAAASECIRLMALLLQADTPHAQTLAILVSARLVNIAEHGAGAPLTDAETTQWVNLAKAIPRSV